MGKTLNFDLFMAEQKKDPILVTIFGKEYPVKPEIPAKVMVSLARSAEGGEGDGDIGVAMLNAADQMFGKKAVDEFAGKMNTEQLGQLMKMVFEMVNGKDVDGNDVEEVTDESGMTTVENKAKK